MLFTRKEVTLTLSAKIFRNLEEQLHFEMGCIVSQQINDSKMT